MSVIAEADILNAVIMLIEETLKVPADKVDIDANFETFGINSLIVMELMENIEKQFEVTLTPAQFSNVDSVRGLSELLEKLTRQMSASAAPATVSPVPAPAAAPAQAAAQASPMFFAPSPAQPVADPYRHVLDYIRGKYAIELPNRGYGSVDEIVESLVWGHTGDLLRYYGISDTTAMPAADGHAGSARTSAVAIVGISCRLPDAPDHSAFWDNLIARRNSMREVPKSRWDWEAHYAEDIQPGKTVSKWGALIDDVDCFDAAFFNIPAEEATSMDPQQRLLLQETYRAVEDAGIDMKHLSGSRTGVFVGYEYSEYEHHLRRLNNKDFTKGPLFSSSSPSYYLSNRISYVFDLCGPSESFNVNCASSAVAINRAYYSLLNGESDVAIAGAVSLNLFEDDYIASSQYGVLSPDGSSGVFDDDAKGFTRGEGVAALVLKRLEDAERDRDRIYAVVRSCHQNYRGAARNISEVKYESIARALTDCYEKAGVPLESLSYIEVDGYATKWADSFEYEGVKSAFEKSAAGRKHVALGSVKGNIGNVESVSGIANTIKIALSMLHKRFPATISKNKVNTFIDIDNAAHPLYIADREIAFDDIRDPDGAPIRAGINSFADSGSNVHILLEEYLPKRAVSEEAPGPKRLFVLSARNAERLQEAVQNYIVHLESAANEESFVDLVYTSQIGREAMHERLAIVAGSRKELLDKLRSVAKNGIREKLGLESREIYHARVNPADKQSVAVLITAEMAQTQLLQSAHSAQWKQIAMLWANGVSMPWESIWRGADVRRTSLPTYPFARDRYWMDVQIVGEAQVAVAKSSLLPTVSASAAPETHDAGASADDEWYFYTPADAADVPADAENMGAVDKIEFFLRYETAKQLGLPQNAVAVDRNFIDLGMNSIGVADLIIKTDRLLHTNLSPSVVFKHPEIGSLAGYLGDQFAEALDALVVTRSRPPEGAVKVIVDAAAAAPARTPEPEDILIPLQTKGDRTPLFAVPGAGGSALSLQQLSHAFGPKQPVYCLEAVGLDGDAPAHASVEDIAEFNLRAMRTVQPRGPYRVLGYSNGGIVAFEMVRRLVDEHQEQASLALLDTLSPLLPGKDAALEMTEVFNHFIGSIGGVSTLDAETLRAVPENERAEYLHGIVTDLGLDVPKRQFVATFRAADASETACLAYRPEKLGGKAEVVLFRATEGYPDAPQDYGWNALLSQPLRVHPIQATHFTLIEPDSVGHIAKAMNAPAKSQKKAAGKREALA